ncbi:hypothetical protein SAMN06265182_0441 [Persephonella hydrogeniphila]|uniref:Uncharacterized protein n=1 Tax=Persephonella hydrogeniphila TaxID=198703 RepID=A0A285N404_9AQUI|nr:hypothetical protein SAMN06265182_0441 [Persephonella hydrogeniphila]
MNQETNSNLEDKKFELKLDLLKEAIKDTQSIMGVSTEVCKNKNS